MSVHPLGNTKLRSAETFAKYHDNPKRSQRSCFICDDKSEIMLNAVHWRLMPNEFPYDAVASIHLLLSPIRHVSTYDELNIEEKEELLRIKKMLDAEGNFDSVIENLERGRTYLPHYHLHLVQWLRV